MSEQNGDGHKTATVQPPVGRPFASGHDPRRNVGGRPKGLAVAARAVVGENGQELIAFFSAVMKADREYLGDSKVTMDHRLEAAKWLGDRAFGRATLVIEQHDASSGALTPEVTATLREMPAELQDAIRQWLQQRREEWLAQEREAAERRMMALMPEAGPDGNGSG